MTRKLLTVGLAGLVLATVAGLVPAGTAMASDRDERNFRNFDRNDFRIRKFDDDFRFRRFDNDFRFRRFNFDNDLFFNRRVLFDDGRVFIVAPPFFPRVVELDDLDDLDFDD